MRPTQLQILASALLIACVLSGCATTSATRSEDKPYRYTDQGTVVWLDEYEFAPPGAEWKLVQIEGGDEFAFAFLRRGSCPKQPCQSVFAYDEDPFGYSTFLQERMREFFKRYLWASHVRFTDFETEKVRVLGGEGLAAVGEAADPVEGYKVRGKVVMGRRGDRVVSFYLTQYRALDGTFDDQEVKAFDKFVDSFQFLKPSFYETL